MRTSPKCWLLAFLAVCCTTVPVLAKDRKQAATLPSYILVARTIAVRIEPNAGHDLQDPNANRVAQQDVEEALETWGRYQVVFEKTADLVVVIRRGNGKAASITASDPSQNERPGYVQPTQGGVRAGAQTTRRDRQPAEPQVEVGSPDDSFTVYQGSSDSSQASNDPVEYGPAGWRLIRKDALTPHTVPAVEAFHKAVVEAEQAAAKP